MKKVIALVMVCGFAVAFASCGGGSSTTESTTDTTAMATDTTATATPTDTTKTDSTQMN